MTKIMASSTVPMDCSSVEENVHIGCCGFRASQSKYFQKFSLVEVQHTFYQPPQLKTLIKWRQAAPSSFEFTIKAWQRITHLGTSPTYKRVKEEMPDEVRETCGNFQPSEVVHEALQTTLACASALQAKKILFQCPAAFKPTDDNVENMQIFFRTNARPPGITYLWEPRGAWPEALIDELCRELNLIHVVDPFQAAPVTQGLYYYRIHGRRGKQVYSDEDLAELLEAIIPGEETYVLFNNIYMIQDAERFKKNFS